MCAWRASHAHGQCTPDVVNRPRARGLECGARCHQASALDRLGPRSACMPAPACAGHASQQGARSGALPCSKRAVRLWPLSACLALGATRVKARRRWSGSSPSTTTLYLAAMDAMYQARSTPVHARHLSWQAPRLCRREGWGGAAPSCPPACCKPMKCTWRRGYAAGSPRHCPGYCAHSCGSCRLLWLSSRAATHPGAPRSSAP